MVILGIFFDLTLFLSISTNTLAASKESLSFIAMLPYCNVTTGPATVCLSNRQDKRVCYLVWQAKAEGLGRSIGRKEGFTDRQTGDMIRAALLEVK